MYELCLAAALGQLQVEIHGRAGEYSAGVPRLLGEPGPDWPGTGPSVVIEIDHRSILLEDIASCTIVAPPR